MIAELNSLNEAVQKEGEETAEEAEGQDLQAHPQAQAQPGAAPAQPEDALAQAAAAAVNGQNENGGGAQQANQMHQVQQINIPPMAPTEEVKSEDSMDKAMQEAEQVPFGKKP